MTRTGRNSPQRERESQFGWWPATWAFRVPVQR